MLRKAFLIVLGCMAALLIADTDVSGAVELQYKFNPGEVVRHKIVVDMDAVLAADIPNAPQLPPVHIKMVGIVKQKTLRILPDGDAEVVDTLESMTMTIGNQTKKLPLEKIPAMTGVVSKYGPSNPLSISGKGGSMFSSIPLGNAGLTQFIVLPAQALNIGDYWTDAMNLPLGINVQQRSTLTAERSKLGSYTVAVVKQEISGNMDIPISQLMELAGQMARADCPIPVDGTLKALIIGGSNTYFSIQKGRAIRTEGTMDMQMDANVATGQQAGRVTIRARLNYSINIVPPK